MRDDGAPGRCPRLEKGLLVLILASSLLLRLTWLDAFLTVDEPVWRKRSLSFYNALVGRDLKATYQSEHPGVVTMWIGTVAVFISDVIDGAGAHSEFGRKIGDALGSSRNPDFPQITFWARRIVALVSWLGVLIVSVLLRRAFGSEMALMATALVALDPFYLANSRVHHLDALLATFTMLSVVSLLAYQHDGRRWRYLALSAVSGGLAIANRSSGVLLLAWALCVLATEAWRPAASDRRRCRLRVARAMACWCIIAGGAVVALWPALWVDPLGTARNVMAGTLRQVLHAHEHSNFFWFQERPDPGVAFCPVACALRITPWVMMGLIALPVLARKHRVRRQVVEVALFICAYAGLVTVSSKKLDRYLLAVFPLLDILAGLAYGLVAVGPLSRRRWERAALAFLVAIVASTQLALIWPARPYYLAYYNPLVGGTSLAPQILLVGWGEGLEKVADYLNEKPNAQDLHVSGLGHGYSLDPFFVGHTTPVGAAPLVEPDYFVLYSSQVQRDSFPTIMGHFFGVERPEYVASVNGLEYAWVYPNTFYRREALAILDHIASQGRSDGDVVVLNANAAFRRDYRGPLRLSIIAGPPRDDFVLNGLQRASAGRDRVWFLSFPDTREAVGELIRGYLEKQASRTEVVVIDGVRAVGYELHEHARFVGRNLMYPAEFRLGDRIRLLGYDLGQTELTRGGALSVRLYWHASQSTSSSYTVFTHLLGPDGELYGQLDSVPQGGARPTTTWLTGEIVLDDYKIEIAQDAPAGEYLLEVGMYDLTTMERLPVSDEAGQHMGQDRVLIGGLHLP